jgi:hypothetical protein
MRKFNEGWRKNSLFLNFIYMTSDKYHNDADYIPKIVLALKVVVSSGLHAGT